ncbi:MAG: chromosomal replication initiator protein DnaA [Oscillospiraceae bacterium]|nr:chromosomal replication initiator protein DnaA [Oscillospiraceae bacterium]
MNSFEEIFDLMKSNLDITDVARKAWIEPIKPVRLNNNTAVLQVSTPFVKQILQENYSHIFKEHLKEILGFDVEIEILCENSDESSESGDNDSHKPGGLHTSINKLSPIPELQDDFVMVNKLHKSLAGSNYQHTFETFIEGNSNKLAYAACKSIAQGLQKNYNPLYIYGNPGLGKTHLLSAVKNELTKNKPNLNIVFSAADDFFNDFVNSIKFDKTVQFKNKYRNADVLLIDDVQFFSGKAECQQELFNTFNELHSNGKQIIFTSDRAPKEINNIEQRLQSRFEWGLLADISTPEFETRLAIIERKAKLIGLEIQPLIMEHIADKLKTNIRQLEGAIIKMNALSLVTDIPPTLTMAKNVIQEILDEQVPTPVTIEKVINEVGSIYGLTGEEIRSKKRNANISTARQIAIYVVHKITGLSYIEIGREFGNRDHSTIVYAVNKVKSIVKKDKAYRNTIDDLIKNIGNL